MKHVVSRTMTIALSAVVSLVLGGQAAAQGTFNNGAKKGGFSAARPPQAVPTYGVPSVNSAPASRSDGVPRIYGAPEAPRAKGFEPYKPPTAGSTYGRPPGSASGAKPCETSVYVNACGR